MFSKASSQLLRAQALAGPQDELAARQQRDERCSGKLAQARCEPTEGRFPKTRTEGREEGAPSPLHSCSSLCRVVLSERHPASTWGVKTNFSKVGTSCSCCRRGAAVVCSLEMQTPPDTVLARQELVLTSATMETHGLV